MARTKRGHRAGLIIKYLRCPVRLLTRARDLCVQSLTGGHVIYGNAMGCPAPQIPGLIRTSPATNGSGRPKTDSDVRQSKVKVAVAPAPAGNRTAGLIGRIDEERECDFEEGHDNVGLLGRQQINPKCRFGSPARLFASPISDR